MIKESKVRWKFMKKWASGWVRKRWLPQIRISDINVCVFLSLRLHLTRISCYLKKRKFYKLLLYRPNIVRKHVNLQIGRPVISSNVDQCNNNNNQRSNQHQQQALKTRNVLFKCPTALSSSVEQSKTRHLKSGSIWWVEATWSRQFGFIRRLKIWTRI